MIARRLRFALGIAALAVVLWAVAGHPLVNYDSLYALSWGREIAHGHAPDYAIPIAPTPHPLWNLLGAVLTQLSQSVHAGVHGQAAQIALLVIALVTLALLGWLTYAIGAAWFDPAIGLLAALIVLTRRPVLDFGARAYMDIPYLDLVLGAVLIETRRAKAGAPVLALLAVAGLIRPEAWLLAGAYWLYLWRTTDRAWALLPLAVAGPALWGLADLIITGDPLSSLTGTRDTAETLNRVTGLQHVPTTAPRRIGEIIREPVLFGAFGGGIMSLLWLRDRARLLTAVGVLSIVAFCVLAVSGLPIIGRYLLLPSVILCIFGAAGALGWRLLPRDDPHRRWWAWYGLATIVLLVAFIPFQVNSLRAERRALVRQGRIESDLAKLVDQRTLRTCAPIAVPNHRAVPVLSLWLDIEPQQIVSAEEQRITRGTYIAPATAKVNHDYILDPNDPQKVEPRVPRGFRLVAQNRSWKAYQRC